MGTATTGEDEVMILRGCEGAYGMRDDVICCIPSRGRGNRAINRDVVFIPGDIQDLEEDMEKEPSAKPFKQMSLERTAALLCQRYNHNANIFVIRPTRKRGTFSEFDNFLVAGKSAMHLIALLASAKRRLGSTNSNNNSIISTTDTELLCFSKGCIVMNQILADLAAAVCSSNNNNVSSLDDDLQFFDTDDPAMKNAIPPYYLVNVQVQQQRDDVDENEATMRYLRSHRDRILSFFDTVSAVHWIDGHRFITSKRILRCLAEYLKQRNTNAVSRSEEEAEEGRRQRRGKGLRFFLHSTPYELDDPEMRPQVRPELNAFREGLLLSSFLKSDEKQQQQQQEQWVKFYSYFEGEPRSIYQHFHLLSIFALPTTSSQP